VDLRVLLAAGIAFALRAVVLSGPVWRVFTKLAAALDAAGSRITVPATLLQVAGTAGAGIVTGNAVRSMLGPAHLSPLPTAVAVAAAVGAAYAALRKAYVDASRLEAGVKGEHRAAEVLNRLPEGAVLHGLRLRGPGARPVEIDHLLLHPRAGIVVIETKAWGGTLTVQGSVWRHESKGRTETHEAPDVQAAYAASKVAGWLRSLGFGAQGLEESILPVVVLASRAQVVGTPAVRVIHVDDLQDFIGSLSRRWPLVTPPEQVARVLAQAAGLRQTWR
jgi:hypothetical protein